MLSLAMVEEVHRLLGEGQMSQRQIARRLGVSRGSVWAIATGQRGLWGRTDAPDHPLTRTLRRRCPRCGYLVTMPCVACRARDYSVHKNMPTVA